MVIFVRVDGSNKLYGWSAYQFSRETSDQSYGTRELGMAIVAGTELFRDGMPPQNLMPVPNLPKGITPPIDMPSYKTISTGDFTYIIELSKP